VAGKESPESRAAVAGAETGSGWTRSNKGGKKTGGALVSATAILIYLALVKLAVLLLTAESYGYYRDELYFIAASERLAWGYVDFPPLVAAVTAFVRWAFGDSLPSLHIIPALVSTGTVVLAGLIARELGGGRLAQGTAALATLIAPTILAVSTWLSMDAFDQLFWTLGAYLMVRILNRDQPRLWLLFGLVMGLGLLNKVTILYFGLAVFVALLATPARRHLRTVWPWLGGALSFIFLLPYAYWQIQNGWPTMEFFGNYSWKVEQDSPPEFLLKQILTMHPVTLPLWLAGLYYLLFVREGRLWRPVGLVFLMLFVLFVVQNGKFYYLAPAYPMLFAAGGVALERYRIGWPRWDRIRVVYVSVLAVVGAVSAPLTVLPVLPVETLASITGTVNGNAGIEAEAREAAQIPLNFADRFGWEEMVATVAGVYEELPPEEQAEACILTGNYGEAGAIDFFGPEYGLPKAISGHNNYYLWGPGGCTGETVIAVNVPRGTLRTVFDDVEEADTVSCEYCMPDENNLPIYVVRSPKVPLEEAWPKFKFYK
jgi:hypothetical protein